LLVNLTNIEGGWETVPPIMLDAGRKADLEYLYRRRLQAIGSERISIDNSISSILNENGMVRSMREQLIRETKNGRWDNVKDINEYIKNKWQYQ